MKRDIRKSPTLTKNKNKKKKKTKTRRRRKKKITTAEAREVKRTANARGTRDRVDSFKD
jgi:hypothetical protein